MLVVFFPRLSTFTYAALEENNPIFVLYFYYTNYKYTNKCKLHQVQLTTFNVEGTVAQCLLGWTRALAGVICVVFLGRKLYSYIVGYQQI